MGSNELKYLLPASVSRPSSIRGSGQASCCITAFSHWPSFFFTRTTESSRYLRPALLAFSVASLVFAVQLRSLSLFIRFGRRIARIPSTPWMLCSTRVVQPTSPSPVWNTVMYSVSNLANFFNFSDLLQLPLAVLCSYCRCPSTIPPSPEVASGCGVITALQQQAVVCLVFFHSNESSNCRSVFVRTSYSDWQFYYTVEGLSQPSANRP